MSKKKKLKKSDGGIVIATKEEAFWLKVKQETQLQIEGLERGLKFNRAVMFMILRKLAEEKRRSK